MGWSDAYDRGANPSARYDWSSIDGYTPFLLACELNEDELVTHILNNATEDSKDDIINTVYRNRRNGQAVSYEKICQHFDPCCQIRRTKLGRF